MNLPQRSKPKAYKNAGLFVDYFLDEKLPSEGPWREALADSQVASLFSDLKALYEKKKPALPGMNEAQTEAEFIRPVLEKILGFAWIPQTAAKGLTGRLVPDYALFADEPTKEQNTASVKSGNYANVLAIADAKFWDRPLDKKIADSRDTLTNQNPSFQISSYLIATKVKWAILTNGRLWRLYSLEHSDTMGEFYQVDIQQLLETGSLEDWLYFYLFFRKDAFIAVPAPSFIDQVIKASIDYGAALEDNLKKKIFEDIFVFLAKGFFDWRRKNGLAPETPETLKEIFDGTLILLYRLLFMLYAESRDLLPVKEEQGYWTKSLDKVKHEIKADIENNKKLSEVSTDYWDDLANLFHIIDVGDPALNMPKYNGGLFASDHRFLAANKLADSYLAEALYFLTTYQDKTTGNWVFIDYKSLGVRQLGSIYEGLLEFHLNVADQELAVVKEKGKEKYVPVGQQAKGQKDTGLRVKPGELYLENTKAERKATGSYYTPDYIVQYIVENSVGPLVDDLEQAFEDQVAKFKKDPKYRGQDARWKTVNIKEFDPALKALELKICDPAMGSGHFLVAAVDYIAKRINKILADKSGRQIFGQETYESPLYAQIEAIRVGILREMDSQGVTIDKEKLEDDKVIIRRMVMKRCIFGVDLNYLAVELAKLALWLNSFTVGAPLSFLDHHLRWGNSLIGSSLDELGSELKRSVHTGKMAGLIGAAQAMIAIGGLTDSTISELEQSQADYQAALALLKPYKQALDLFTSSFFGNSGAGPLLKTGKIDIDNLEASLAKLSKESQAIAAAAGDIGKAKRFFHWELEFPEVFYGLNGRKEGAGFDVVIGNPPYVSNWSLTAADPDLPAILTNLYNTVAVGHWDLYILFIFRAISHMATGGMHSFITPSSLATEKYGHGIRRILLTKYKIMSVLDFGEHAVFDEVARQYLIYVVTSPYDSNNSISLKRFETGKVVVIGSVPQQAFVGMPNCAIRLNLNEAQINIKAAILNHTFYLGQLCCVNVGVVAHSRVGSPFVFKKDDVISVVKQSSSAKQYVAGDEIGRYSINWSGAWIEYESNADFFHRPKFPELFESSKIIIRRVSGESMRLISSLDYNHFYTNDNLIHVLKWTSELLVKQSPGAYEPAIDSPISIAYLGAIISSRVIGWFYSTFIATGTLQGSYTGVYPEEVRMLPIRRISFTTLPGKRQQMREEAKRLYLKAKQLQDLLNLIDDCLEKKHQPDPELVKRHNIDPHNKDFQIREGAPWEQSDVVHDFLAFLAERMITMNKEKQEEITGFLKDFQRTASAAVDDLTNKTLIKEYHRHSFNEVLAVLEKNRNKLKGFNPKARTDRELLEAEFNKSVAKLTPLKAKIQATDELVDQIVYKLYGLTTEEIKIVEESIGR